MKGRKPTATGFKKLAGTYRKDRDPGDKTLSIPIKSLPKPPEVLNKDGVEIWNAVCGEMSAIGALQSLDLWLLEIACHAFQCYREKARTGTEVTSTERIALKGMFSEFGLSPVSRRRVQPIEAKPNNPFDELGDTP